METHGGDTEAAARGRPHGRARAWAPRGGRGREPWARGTPCVGARAAAPQYFWNGREARQPRAASKPDARGLRASRPCSELIVTANSGFFSNLDRVRDWVWEVGLLTRTSPSPQQAVGIWRLASARQVQSTRVPAAVC